MLIDLRGRQRRAFLGYAAFFTVAALAVLAWQAWHGWWNHGAGLMPMVWAATALSGGLYSARVAYGWTRIEADGLHTSRLLRGRYLRWHEIDRITTRTYRGRGSHVTVVRVHTRSGRTYRLPAPRTTLRSDPEFDKLVERIQQNLIKYPGR